MFKFLQNSIGALSMFFMLSSTQAALIDNGGGLIYDDVLDITWAQPDVLRTWDDANAWVSGLTLGGVTGWTLPYISASAGPITSDAVDCSAPINVFACPDNELGYMFYYSLGGVLGFPISTIGHPDLALFPSLQSDFYWSSNSNWPGSDFAWGFTFSNGSNFNFEKTNEFYSWATHVGNVSPVPIPVTAWLFGSALGLLGWVRRRTV